MGLIRLSSNWTLILRLFLPVAWVSFFGAFFASTLLADAVEVPKLVNPTFRMGLAVFILSGMVFFRFTFLRLRRVDADSNFLYVSDYFRTYRYTLNSIERFVIYDHLVVKAVHVFLREKGRMGKRLIFLPKMIHFNRFVDENGLQDMVESAS